VERSSSTINIINNYRVAPNPARASITLLDYQPGDAWMIVASDGRHVLSGTTSTIDVMDLPRGIYYFRVVRKDGVGVQALQLH
jgi:hypothetical protein